MYEASYRVRFSETGKDGKMSMNGVLRLFQDCGYEHALDRGFGPDFTKRTRCTWYLILWNISIIDAPCAGDEIVLKTYIYDMQESLAKKYIAMYDKCGKCLAKADTVWVYMNIDTQAPALPDRNDMGWLPQDFGDRSENDAPHQRIKVPQDGMKAGPYRINDYLLDTNGHANNVRLTEFAMSVAGADNGKCNYLRAEFKRQVMAGSAIIASIKKDYHDDCLTTTVVFSETGKQENAVFYFSSPK